MLITRWLRIRSPPCKAFCASEHHARQHIHSTSLHRNAPSQSQIIQPIYIDTIPPTPEQLHASEIFFKTHVPTKSWTATEWRQQPHSESTYLTPEVAFLGRSNSGKSSLLNGLLLDPKLCRVGAKPGKTITMHAWSLSPVNPETRGARKGHQGDMEPKLTVLDMPGYGHGSHGEWGAAIMKYLTARRQLRRAFVLVNALHGLKEQDLQMLELLRSHGIPHQMIACKADRMKASEAPALLSAMQAHIDKHFSGKRQVPLLMTVKDILTVGGLEETKESSKWLKSAQGLHDVRWAILRAAGLEEYAMMLAANGGKLPKAKHNKSALADQRATEDSPLSQQVDSEQQIHPEDDYELVQPSMPGIAPQDTASIRISANDLMSESFNPMSDHSSDSGRSADKDYTKLGADESVPRRESFNTRNIRSQQHLTGSGMERRGPSRTKTWAGNSSRTKDVKRYGARNR